MFFPFCLSFHCSYCTKGKKYVWVREWVWDEEWERFCTSISCIEMKSKEFLSFEITVKYIQLLSLLNFCVRNNWEGKKKLNKSWWRLVSVWEKSSEIKTFFCLLLLRLLRPWAAGMRLHPYDLNKQHTLAEVTGAVEGGWGGCSPGAAPDATLRPWGLKCLLLNPAGCYQTVAHGLKEGSSLDLCFGIAPWLYALELHTLAKWFP